MTAHQTPIQIHPTERFYLSFDVFCSEVGDGALAVGQLTDAIARLASDFRPDNTEPSGASGDTFTHWIGDQYGIRYRIETDRDENKKPLLVHVRLLNIERRSAD